MVAPQLTQGDHGSDLDPDLVFGERRVNRFGTTIRAGGGAYRQGSGRPGAPPPGERFTPTRDLGARRGAYEAGAPSGSLGHRLDQPSDRVLERPASLGAPRASGTIPPRPIIPGERRYRDG